MKGEFLKERFGPYSNTCLFYLSFEWFFPKINSIGSSTFSSSDFPTNYTLIPLLFSLTLRSSGIWARHLDWWAIILACDRHVFNESFELPKCTKCLSFFFEHVDSHPTTIIVNKYEKIIVTNNQWWGNRAHTNLHEPVAVVAPHENWFEMETTALLVYRLDNLHIACLGVWFWVSP